MPVSMLAVCICWLACLLLAGPAAAGVVIEVETVTPRGSEMHRERSQISIADDGAIRIDTTPVGENPATAATSMIFAAGSAQAMVVDHGNQTYSTMDGDSLERMAQQIEAATQQVEKQIENLPADQRQALRDALTSQNAPRNPPMVHPTEERATKNGFKCRRYMVRQNGRVIREAWVASWDQIPDGDQVKQAFDRLQQYFAGVVERLEKHSSPLLGGDIFELRGQTFEDLDQMNGLPIVVTTIEDSDIGEEREVRRVSQREFDAATFQPPSGYQPAANR